MEVTRPKGSAADVVLGPCPGCGLWQLDYTYEVAKQWVEIRMDEIYEFGSDIPSDFIPWIDTSGFHDVVEDILAEHLDECPHLQRLIFEA